MSNLKPEQKVKIAQACVDFVDAMRAEGFDDYDIKTWIDAALHPSGPSTAPGMKGSTGD